MHIVMAFVGAILLMGCQPNTGKHFLFPNNLLVAASPLDSLERQLPFQYQPYVGFKGALTDSLFPSFTVLQAEKARLIQWAILDKYEQAELRRSPVTGIRLEKVQGKVEDSTKVNALVLERYSQCELDAWVPFEKSVQRAWDLVNQETGQKVGILTFSPRPGWYILELVPF
jgi:hypothetical protein